MGKIGKLKINKKVDKIEKIQGEINKIKIELVMKDYNSGWTTEGLQKRLKVLENKLKKEINTQNGNSSIFHEEG